MTAYATAAALRRAIEDRLRNQAETSGTSLMRLRRRTVLERLLIRLDRTAPGDWTLKGGMALELRLGDRARATKDIDLTFRDANRDGQHVRAQLVESLSTDPDGDRFEFTVGKDIPLDADLAGRPGWRFTVQASLAGQLFDAVRLDVVARPEEISGTERISLPGLLGFADLPTRQVEVIDRLQHFSEKLHALTRTYGERLNSRTKDLVDLIILIDNGLPPSAELVAAVRHVFDERRSHPMPVEIPDPPAAWRERYAQSARELALSATDIDTATDVLRGFWRSALAAAV